MTMKKTIFLICFSSLYAVSLFSQPKIKLEDYATDFTRPVDIAHCNDSRLFIVEQRGYIWILDSLGNKIPGPFLDIDARVRSNGNEQGLLGLAFPPDYAEKGYFYVNYTRETNGDTRISRFSRDTLDPNKADPDSELILMTVDQPYANHNGGCLKFGPDGYLYAGLGDGGSGGDPQGNGQKKSTLLGKILRIDVSNSSPSELYTVPADNPFVNDASYLPEIWSLGWRNPWRFSFDRLTGDLWVGDVGQGQYEEIDFEPAATPGLNYGWRCYEGTHPYNTNGCQSMESYVSPIFDYQHSNANGCSVTGGFIYRGAKYADLYGCYLFADYCSGRWWYSRHNADGNFTTSLLANLSPFEYSGFGEDRDGELYVALLDDGKIQRITELCSDFQMSAAVTQQNICTGTYAGIIEAQTSGGAQPLSYEWSNQQVNSDMIVYLEAGLYSVTVTDANGCARIDTVEMTNSMPDPPAPVITAPAEAFCSGASLVLTSSPASGANTYQWYSGSDAIPGAQQQTLTVTNGGMYRVQIIGGLCAPFSDTFFVEEVSLTPPSFSISADTLQAAGATGFMLQWYQNGQPIPGATDDQLIVLESGFYALEISDDLGCKAISEQVYVDISSVNLPSVVRQCTLAPNPSGGLVYFTLELERTENITLALVDTQQRQIFMQTHQSRQLSIPVDLRALPAGTYFLNVQLESGWFVRRVVKY
ncbi:MAG: PQQ-dependent sugar dehydrogenase [Lewinellaceae bacterium]|nr:PQQ-dependent sugar dehydrogenase [Lewinellaceae bacterium]